MRNLKRALSLALAVVMVVGLMIVGASAAGVEDFGDYAGIKNKEAVGLLVDLGVIKGGNDGNFSPKGTLTRGEFAKIAYLLSQTQTDYTRYAGTGVAKDAAGHWSEGALVWCNTWRNQIITGGTDGNFYPNDKLTVVQCAVMMLRVLGYNNYLEGFTGAGWEIRTLNKADEVKLMVGLENLKAGDPISRDDACRMAYNALFIDRVYHNETWNPTAQTMVPTGYDKDHFTDGEDSTLATATFSIAKAEKTVTKVDAAGKAYETVPDPENEGQTKDVEIPGLTATPDMVGVKVAYYARGTKVLSAAPVASAQVVATIDGRLWDAKVGNGKDYELDSKVAYVLNGETVDNATAASIDAGSVVELVNTDADKKIEVVRVTNKKVDVLAKDPDLKDGKLSIDFTTNTDITNANPKTVVGYENLKKGDVVLFAKIGAVTYIEKAAVTTGKVTKAAVDKSYYTVGGKDLYVSALNGTTQEEVVDSEGKTDFKNEYNFFLDNGGNIVAFATAGEAPTVVVKHAVVTDFGYVSTGPDTGIGGSAGTTTFQVQLLFPDGNSDVVEFNSIKLADGKTYTPNGTDKLDAALVTGLKAYKENGDAETTNILGTIVSYTTDKDSKYALEVKGEALEGNDINGGKAAFSTNVVGNKNTTFLVKVKGEKAIRVITGIAGLPTSTTAKSNGVTLSSVIEDKGFVTLAYLEIKGIDGESVDQVAYFLDNSKAEETANGFEVKAVVDGKLETLFIATANYTGDLATLKGMATVTYVDGKVTSATAFTTAWSAGNDTGLVENITAKAGGIITFGADSSKKVFQYDENTVIVNISDRGAETIAADKIPVSTTGENAKQYDAYIELESASSDVIEVMYIYVHSAG